MRRKEEKEEEEVKIKNKIMTPVMAKIRHRAHRGENIMKFKNILGKSIIWAASRIKGP